jgi:hypothetical protein
MKAFDLAVQLRRSALDTGMTNALISEMAVELGLELMAADGIDEVDHVGLYVFVVDLECFDAGGATSLMAVHWSQRIFSP